MGKDAIQGEKIRAKMTGMTGSGIKHVTKQMRIIQPMKDCYQCIAYSKPTQDYQTSLLEARIPGIRSIETNKQ